MTRRITAAVLAVAFAWVCVASAASPPAGPPTQTIQDTFATAPGTSATKADPVQGVLSGIPIPILASLWWTENTGSSVAANATMNATIRASGSTAGNPSPYGYFSAKLMTNNAGSYTVYDMTTPGSPVQVQATQSVAANSVTTIKAPAFGTQFMAQFVCGSTACTISLSDGYTAN